MERARRFHERLPLAALLASAALLSACEDNEPSAAPATPVVASPDTFITCQAKEWQPVPQELAESDIAYVLDVDPAQIREGKLGNVVCDHAVRAASLSGSGEEYVDYFVAVEGEDEPCLVVGIDSEGVPEEERAYTDLVVVCPASGISA